MSIFSEVTASEDFLRIQALPKRKVNPYAYVEPVTKALALPGDIDRKYPHKLLPIQAWALYELSRCGGLFGPIGVGHGKTGLDILAALVVPGCKVACLLIPASLREQIYRDFDTWSKNFRVPNLIGSGRPFDPSLPSVYIITYDALSRERSANYLDILQPDLIIADEAHHLRHKGSTRTRRVLRYFAAHPNCRFACWSGTLTSNSIKDYAHLAAIALRKGSPVPINWAYVEEWSEALDANSEGTKDYGVLISRDHFHDRLVSTFGVVSTRGESVECSLYFIDRHIEAPGVVCDALKRLRETWQRPDGEELVEASQVYRCGRELASGFYYKWTFPHGESPEQIAKWLEVRAGWHKELREKLKQNKPYLDSPLLCARAAQRYHSGYVGDLPTWTSEWFEQWMRVKGTVRPVTVPVWLSEFLIDDLVKCEKAIIWYEHDTFGAKLKERGIPVYGAGDLGILAEGGERTIAASIRAHGTGKNLQAFSNNVFGNYPSSHSAWEQVVGRTHRQGQKADEVIVQVYRHTPEMREAFAKARGYARYVEETMGVKQKILTASYTFPADES